MKVSIFVSLLSILIFSNYSCMPMWGMHGMHGVQGDYQTSQPVRIIQKEYQNDDYTISLEIPPLTVNKEATIQLNVKYNMPSGFSDTPHFMVRIRESESTPAQSIEINAEGKYPIIYDPKSVGMVLISVDLIDGDFKSNLINVWQMVYRSEDSYDFLNNPNIYIAGGLLMGFMMFFMFAGGWM